MPKKRTIILGVIALCILALLSRFVLGMNTLWFLPEGNLVGRYPSPDSKKTVAIYVCNGGATVANSIRGALESDSGRTKNIYWGYREETASVEWVDDDHVEINDISLDIRRDVYDWRKNQ